MATPGRLHLIATLALVALMVGIGLAEAGVFGTPTGGWGIDRPAPSPSPDNATTAPGFGN